MEVVNKVGLLDTNYALGMWDDNDYCIAAKKFGYDVKLLADICITHHGRTTFTLLQETENFNITYLMAKNKTYLDKKWRLGISNTVPRVSQLPNNIVGKVSWRDKVAQVQQFV
jgi:GT2 family glycosyltransferase